MREIVTQREGMSERERGHLKVVLLWPSSTSHSIQVESPVGDKKTEDSVMIKRVRCRMLIMLLNRLRERWGQMKEGRAWK